ncbi:GRIP and coiled-coil domain-containing protein 1 [Bulinus truncatus]|nr:GRIP and coiled-coil domain-containing protein 1 [Bulinus truncatus]
MSGALALFKVSSFIFLHCIFEVQIWESLNAPMEKLSRVELIDTINNQSEQLQQYKSKLRDVVAAYKSVTKEKEALEASLAALSSCNSSFNSNSADNCASKSISTEEEGIVTPDPLGIIKQEVKDDSIALRDQIKTLSFSLTTITQEKNKIEANFIAERKHLKHELEELQAQLIEEKKRASKQVEGFELQISDLKSRIRTQQLEREREQTDHALMLKELQTLLSKERSSKDALEAQLDEVEFTMKDQRSHNVPVVSEVYEKQIQQLQNELQTVRDRLKSAEIKSSQPSPFVLELQKDMANMQADYQKQVEKEQQKAAEAKHRLKTQAKQSEERISSLEAKLSDLSETVGNYERMRFQDQQAISKLRERVAQLDMENTALVHAAKLSPEKNENDLDNMEAEKIIEKIFQLRSVLKNVAEKSEKPIKLSTIFVEDMNKADEESEQCRKYKEELVQLREDFERYKLRAQSVLKNKNKETGLSKETELLKEQVAELRDKLRMSNFHHQEEVAEYQTKIDNLSKGLLNQEEKFKADLAHVKASHQQEIVQLETESKKQRERTIALLAEKDSEIQKLKTMSGQGMDSDVLRHWNSSFGQQAHDGHMSGKNVDVGGHTEEQEAVSQLMDLSKSLHSEAAFLHFAQEKGRMEVELNSLRKQKRQLESALRDLQLSVDQKEEKLRDEVSALQERLADIDRHANRESANVEYLKNVMVKFLTSTDTAGKKQMLKAVMTILQFSPAEKEMIRQSHLRGWWPA